MKGVIRGQQAGSTTKVVCRRHQAVIMNVVLLLLGMTHQSGDTKVVGRREEAGGIRQEVQM